ncbi:MAG: ribosome biogenesis GTPase Der [Bacilli bacterium]|jgi:GTP-binding protein|nr:ribosome biogenesis GTPase Der [Bacilli bacterium]
MSLGTLAIVGAPSVGKSTIFNRIVGERRSIVEQTRGITRDRLYAKAVWLTKTFTVIDTGGIQIKNVPFQEEIRSQVEIAIQQADAILFLVDGKIGLTGDDRFIAKLLYKCRKPVILGVNKIDNINEIGNKADFYALGFGDPIALSGAHGIGIGDALDLIIKKLPEKETPDYGDAIAFSLIGRPNVGKSSLANRLIGEKRTIVSDIAGTTRDSVDSPFERNGHRYVVIDTAGLLKRGKIYEAVDKYASIRALSAIDRSEVAVLVIDANAGILEQDKHVVGYAVDAKKAIVIVVNKWDLAKKGPDAQKEFTERIRSGFKFLDYASVVFCSALTGSGLDKILEAIAMAYDGYNRRIGTSVLNRLIMDAQTFNPTPEFNHGRLKIIYANQVAVCPPTFVLFCNDPSFAHFSYTRYLENKLRGAYDFSGSPINLIYRQRK